MRRCIICLTIILVSLLSPVLADETELTLSEYQRLVNISDSLLASHRKTIEPPLDGYIYITYLRFQFVDLDETEERLTMIMDTDIFWTYKTMRWDVDETADYHDIYLTFNEHDVWYPSFHISNINSRKIDPEILPNKGLITVNSEGGAYYRAVKITETRCSIDATYYPFDEQVCDVRLSVRNLNTNLTLEHLDMRCIFDLADNDNIWSFKKFKLKDFKYADGRYYQVRIYMERKPTWAIVNIIVPIFILVSLTPLVFLLPKEGGERVGLSLTILLAVSVYMTLVSDHLPMSSDPLPIITVVLFVWYTSNTAVVLQVIFNIRIFRLHESKPVPRILKRFVLVTRSIFCQASLDSASPNQKRKVNGNSKNEFEALEKPFCDKDENETDLKADQLDPEKRITITTVKWPHVNSAIDKWLFVSIYCLKIIFATYVFQKMRFGRPEMESGTWDFEMCALDSTAGCHDISNVMK